MEKKYLAVTLVVVLVLFVAAVALISNMNPVGDIPNNNSALENATILVPLASAPLDDSGATIETVEGLSLGTNQFALELFEKIYEGKNTFLSPISIQTALAMTYEGATGQTAQEMRDVLYLQENDVERRASFAGVYNKLNEKNENYELKIVNSIWPQEGFSFVDSYLETIKNHYYGAIVELDYVNDTEGSRKTINAWVEDQTHDRIKDLIPKGAINTYTRLVLTNAIYFKGSWLDEFDKELTQEEDFKVSSSKNVKVNMMRKEDSFNYSENENFKLVELPYKGDKLSMLVLLPQDNFYSEFPSLEEINSLSNSFSRNEVSLKLPRFGFETKYGLVEKFKELGMNAPFSGSADFSKMSPEDLVISAIIHQTFVLVDEEGTIAAAATAVVMDMTSAGPTEQKEFFVDHPFYFIIKEKETGLFLFFGKVVEPVEETKRN